jgi:CheY-like chemotaxis protein
MENKETILYAEDEPDDQFFIERALKQLTCPVEVRFVNDGQEALDYLQGKGQYADRSRFPMPTVIFLDIKMPRLNGFEVLKWLKEQEAFKRIPVAMITSSQMQEDIDRVYELGASAYLVKPARMDELQKLFKVTGEFFVEHVEKPSQISTLFKE